MSAITPSVAAVAATAIASSAAVALSPTAAADPAAPPAPIPAADEGVGLRNAQDRLRLLFGARATLELDLSKPAVATARLRVPQQR